MPNEVAGRRYSRAGNTMPGQRDSGHLAVPSDAFGPRTGYEAGTNLRVNRPMRVYASQRFSQYWKREGSRDISRGQNRTRERRPSGIAGGSWETWPMVEIGTHTATERADMVTLHLRDARAQVLPDRGEQTNVSGEGNMTILGYRRIMFTKSTRRAELGA